ncbi:hypothetical protein B0H14DRAFT_2630141 [Mycena olivaceomarginata]|nr:hypothetical protein B0H14DRAFT_2630141 [Mycena olivaceomarginata]
MWRQAIVKARCFDLPPSIETNAADFKKVIAVVQEALTQLRAKSKLGASLKLNKTDKKPVLSSNHQNIFKLAQIFVEGSQCIKLCARIALMCQVYLQENSPKFWDKLNSTVAGICTKARGNAKMIARAFRHILEKNQDLHSIKAGYSIADSTIEELQQEIDDIIDANTLNMATLGQC